VDVAEIQEAVTDELKKVLKEEFLQLFRNCMIPQKNVYIYLPLELGLIKKKTYVSDQSQNFGLHCIKM
jgi:hypothetical protein